jgi:pyochelin synthetase
MGTINCLHLLLKHLVSQRMGPVVGITVGDTEKYCAFEPYELIDRISDDYADHLLKSGHKQMQLIGYCLGGLIAVEVARRLLEKDIQLVDLALIDAHPVLFGIDDDLVIESLFIPNLNIAAGQAIFNGIGPDDLVRGIFGIIESNNKSVPKGASGGIGGDEGLDKIGALFRRLSALSMNDRFAAYVAAIEKQTGAQMPVEMAEGLFKVYRQSFKAARFTPLPYMGDIRFFLSCEACNFLPTTDQMTLDFWREVCFGEFEVMEIEGNHFSCIEKEPNVSKLAGLISIPLSNK